jgi:hypothetical protein
MSRSLQRQILAAFDQSGLTIDELIRLAGLEMDPASLSRKLRGKQAMRTTECEVLAKALRVVVSTGRSAA